ncbi:hypothetical protein Tco_0377457 [Tanacetum coccineum]
MILPNRGEVSDEGVFKCVEEGHEKASTDTKIFIQEVTPTEVIQDQEGSEKASDEVSTAGAKKDTASEEVPTVSTAEVHLSTAGGTITYSRRSAEKRSRKDKGKSIFKKKYDQVFEESGNYKITDFKETVHTMNSGHIEKSMILINICAMDAEHGSEKQESPAKEKSSEKVVEEEIGTQEELKKDVKEL